VFEKVGRGRVCAGDCVIFSILGGLCDFSILKYLVVFVAHVLFVFCREEYGHPVASRFWFIADNLASSLV
jgi:hypothetical protein